MSEITGSSKTPRSDLRLRGIFVAGVLLALLVLVTLYYVLDLIDIDGRRRSHDGASVHGHCRPALDFLADTAE